MSDMEVKNSTPEPLTGDDAMIDAMPIILYLPYTPDLRPVDGNENPTDREELGALMRLAMHMPWDADGNPATLKGSHDTWTAAFEASNLKRDITANISKKDCASSTNQDLIVIDQVPVIKMADPKLWEKYFNNERWCWHCGETKEQSFKCGKCNKARYCSRQCQKDAWWHHKRDVMNSGCNDLIDPNRME